MFCEFIFFCHPVYPPFTENIIPLFVVLQWVSVVFERVYWSNLFIIIIVCFISPTKQFAAVLDCLWNFLYCNHYSKQYSKDIHHFCSLHGISIIYINFSEHTLVCMNILERVLVSSVYYWSFPVWYLLHSLTNVLSLSVFLYAVLSYLCDE